MSGQTRSSLKLASTVTLAVAAIWFISARYGHFRRDGEAGARVWFYDQKKGQLYAAERDTIPPYGPGVRAIVVTFPGQETDPGKQRIAYLQTYGQPMKDALERMKRDRESGKTRREPPPERGSELFRTNDLVRRVADAEWHAAASPEGRTIMSEWRSWRTPGGQAPVVCLP